MEPCASSRRAKYPLSRLRSQLENQPFNIISLSRATALVALDAAKHVSKTRHNFQKQKRQGTDWQRNGQKRFAGYSSVNHSAALGFV
jgi:hypothetical protein